MPRIIRCRTRIQIRSLRRIAKDSGSFLLPKPSILQIPSHKTAPCFVLTSRQGRCIESAGSTQRRLGNLRSRPESICTALYPHQLQANILQEATSSFTWFHRMWSSVGQWSNVEARIPSTTDVSSANHLSFSRCLEGSGIRPPIANSFDLGTNPWTAR